MARKPSSPRNPLPMKRFTVVGRCTCGCDELLNVWTTATGPYNALEAAAKKLSRQREGGNFCGRIIPNPGECLVFAGWVPCLI